MGTLLHWYLDSAASVFATLIVGAVAGEKVWQYLRSEDRHWGSTMTSITSGLTFMAAKAIVGKGLFVALSLWIYHTHRFFTLDLSNPLVWIGVFLIRDFVYYWVHRAEHSFRILWASHLVHHSPETINMSTAVRVPWMEALYKPFFSLWLPLVGFNPLAAIAMDVFAATLSQLQHTTAFPARPNGLVQMMFVTPSAHRVHHGYNPEYLDKNFGAVLIVWDRLFGTWEPEVAPVRFGVGAVDAVKTIPDALVGGYGRLIEDVRSARGAEEALAIAFSAPGVAPPSPR